MASYYITHRVTEGDPEVMALYSSKVNATFEPFGGVKIVRGGDRLTNRGDISRYHDQVVARLNCARLD